MIASVCIIVSQQNKKCDLPSQAEGGIFPLTIHKSSLHIPLTCINPCWTIPYCHQLFAWSQQKAPPFLWVQFLQWKTCCSVYVDGWTMVKQKRVSQWAIKAVSLCIFILIQRLDVSATNFLRECRIYLICQPSLPSYWKWELQVPRCVLWYRWNNTKRRSYAFSCFFFFSFLQYLSPAHTSWMSLVFLFCVWLGTWLHICRVCSAAVHNLSNVQCMDL